MSDQWEQEFEKWRNCLLFAALRVKIAANFASWKEIGQKRQPNPLFSDVKTGNCSNGLEYLGIKARLKRNVLNALCRMLDMETELAAQLSDRNYTGSGHFFKKIRFQSLKQSTHFTGCALAISAHEAEPSSCHLRELWKNSKWMEDCESQPFGFSEGWK